jgi:hypothetical protein
MIGNPLKAEPVKLFQLLLGTVVRTVAAFNPIQQVPLNFLDAEVRTLLLDVFNGLLKIERVQHLGCSLALGRIHPLEKSVDEGIFVNIVCSEGCLRLLPVTQIH